MSRRSNSPLRHRPDDRFQGYKQFPLPICSVLPPQPKRLFRHAIDNWLAKATKLHRLEENIGATEIELTQQDLREIKSAASQIEVRGARYPERLEQMTGL